MAKVIKKKISIKTRMLFSILGLILIIFIGIVFSFNLIVNSYIEKISHRKIEKVRDIVRDIDNNLINQTPKPKAGSEEQNKIQFFMNVMRKVEEKEDKDGIFSYANFMMINSNYEVVFPKEKRGCIERENNYTLIAEKLKNEDINLKSDNNYKLSVGKSYYYISSFKVSNFNKPENYYVITYLDISNILVLSEKTNKVLTIIMCIATVLSIILSILLSRRIAKPIEELCGSVRKLGEGNFEICNYNFSDRELDELCKIINKTSEQLETYDKEQKIFFQNVSHELRTPLMSIKGYTEGIKYEVIDKNLATDIILEEGDRLEELIEEILYLSKIDNITNDYILEERDLREILSNCTIKQKFIASKNNIKFVYDFPKEEVLYICNEKILYRAFSNIIENSLRYALKEIKIGCKNQGYNIYVYIENDGEFIDEKDLPYIFDRFYKGKKGKHGIGLSIVKSIIYNLNGEIFAENTNFGVRFTIILKNNTI
ncbi:sensor histidine kinase [Clostridium perfringens]|nr:HAMP domain-containing sensor histidine kinase [Clostridium perfringens]